MTLIKEYLESLQEEGYKYLALYSANDPNQRVFWDDNIEKLPQSYLNLKVIEDEYDPAELTIFLLVDIQEEQILDHCAHEQKN